ncbi:putative GTP cyclohydrolase 1 type 2 [compost metagenome]
MFAGADVLVTGDIDYHTAHDALADGMTIIDAGHNIEKIMKQRVAEWLNKQLVDNKYETKAIASALNTEPFAFV